MKKIIFLFLLLFPLSSFALLDVSQSQESVSSAVTVGFWYDLDFSSDGLSLFVLESSTPSYIKKYSLSSAFNLSTLNPTLISSMSISGNILGFDFSTNWLHFYATSRTTGYLLHYTCTTAFDLSSCTYTNQTGMYSALWFSQSDVFISPDGTKLFWNVKASSNNYFVFYTLSTPYDVTTFTNTGNTNFGNVIYSHFVYDSSGANLLFNNNGTSISQFTVSSSYTVPSTTTPTKTFSMSSTNIRNWLYLTSDSNSFYTVSVTDFIWKYNTSQISNLICEDINVSYSTPNHLLEYTDVEYIWTPADLEINNSAYGFSWEDGFIEFSNFENYYTTSDLATSIQHIDSEYISFDSFDFFFNPTPKIRIENQILQENNYILITKPSIYSWDLSTPYFSQCSSPETKISMVYNEPLYTDLSTCFYITFERSLLKPIYIDFISYGYNELEPRVVEKCVDSVTGDIFIDGELTTQDVQDGDIINPVITTDSPIPSVSTLSSWNPLIDKILKPISDWISKYFTDYVWFYDITLPSEYGDLYFEVPTFSINNQMQFEYAMIEAQAPVIQDTLNISIVERNEVGAKFIVFILACLYIISRMILLWIVFYLFFLSSHFLNFMFKKMTGLEMTTQQFGGNVFTVFIMLAWLVVYGTFLISLFVYTIPLLPLINKVSHALTVFFSFFANTFGEYAYFATICNGFFSGIVGLFFLFVVSRFGILYGKLN